MTLPVSARPAPHIESQGASVVINKQTVLRFKVANGNASAEERADLVAERLQAQARLSLSASAIQPRREGRQWRIVVVGRTNLLYVTKKDARADRSEPKALAYAWVKRIRAALTLPPVALSPGRIIVPLGETRTLTLGGYSEDSFATRVEGKSNCLDVESHPATRRLVVHGVRPGKAVVRVRVEDGEAACTVVVMKYAGRIPTQLTAEVTGTPAAPPDLIAQVAAAALRGAPVEPGASVRVLAPLRTHRATRPGESQTLTAPVVIGGAGYLTAKGTARVRVLNRDIPAQQAARLFYSNTPEHISRLGEIYAATLTDNAPARLMYHHDNHTGGALAFAVTLTNPTDHELRVQIISGFTPPGGDPATVGYQAGQVFLRNWLKNRGEIYRVPPRSVVPLVMQRLRPTHTSSGIAQVCLVDAPAEARCRVRVLALPLNGTGFSRQVLTRLDPWRYAAPRPLQESELARLNEKNKPQPIYRACRALEANYTVGDRWTFIPVGSAVSDPASRLGTATPHESVDGDYGVLYKIRITMKNPTPSKQKVEVAFGPGGGPAMAVFSIGGRYLEVRETRPPDKRPLARYTLQPNETRVVTIETVPLGGSSYPANVIVK